MNFRGPLTELVKKFELPLKALALVVAGGLSYAAAFLLRFDLPMPADDGRRFWVTLPVLLGVRAVAIWYWGLHRTWWRYVSLPDLIRILISTAAGSAAFALVVLFAFSGFPRTVLLVDPALLVLSLSGVMVLSRSLHEGRPSVALGPGKRILIVGAGDSGNGVARVLRASIGINYVPVAFVDDDSKKQGCLIQGVPVLGTIDDTPRLVHQYHIEEIVIAMPSAGRTRLREVVEICKSTGARFRILPAASDLIQGRVTVSRLREVRIEDLLGRPRVVFDLDAVRPLLQDSVVCVTGAGGSIGSELCRQLAACAPGLLLMVDRYENTLHYLHTELSERFPHVRVQPSVVDITDGVRMEQLMAAHRPRVIFQAAAYKHVPLMEHNSSEAVKNNVLATRFLAQLADHHGTERFVMISTDKAINPTSVMGASKRVAEQVLQSFQQRSKTRFITVRFGNVLGSDGSVVRIFSQQIARGGPVTVTHPDIVRYFMLVDEAAHLVLHASVLGEGGEIFMLDMGEQVRIIDLATDMIRLSGLQPYVDVDIRFTGLRPGEKLYEELITASEVSTPTDHSKIYRLQEQANPRDWDNVLRQTQELERLALAGQDKLVRQKLRELVPEYRPLRDAQTTAASAAAVQARRRAASGGRNA